MTRWHRSIPTLALLVIGSLVTSTAAQPAPTPKKQPTQQELDRARTHFKTAEAAKARGDYKTAAAEYLAAYELFEDPEFFFDVAEVYRLAGDELNALTYYQKYLKLEPNGRGAATTRTAVSELRRSIAAKLDAAKRADEDEAKRKADQEAKRKADEDAKHKADQEAARRAADAETRRKAAEAAKRKADDDAARRAADDEAKHNQPATPPEVPPAAPAMRAWYRDPITLALVGTGVATTGVGAGFLLSARSLGHEDPKTLDEARSLRDRASRRGTVGLITGGVGIVLVGSGATWIFLHRDSGEQRTITGWLGPGGGGLAITGPF